MPTDPFVILGISKESSQSEILEAYKKKREYYQAHVFDEEALFDRILSEGKDVLKDKHANTTIPKILGALKRYLILDGRELAGEKVDAPRYLRVAEVFFSQKSVSNVMAASSSSKKRL